MMISENKYNESNAIRLFPGGYKARRALQECHSQMRNNIICLSNNNDFH